MLPILLSLGSGVVIGCFIKMSDNQRKVNDKLQFAGIMLLLFSMGISIGMNKTIVSHMFQIGWQALTFSVFCTVFSVLFVYIFSSAKERRDVGK